jgi:hypothetical protein
MLPILTYILIQFAFCILANYMDEICILSDSLSAN